MRVKVAIALFIILAVASPALATNYYVDATNGDNGNTGLSNAQAWKTVAKVNSFSFSTGDDVYFKCGETWTDTKLTVDWDGSSANHVVIGAYYVEGGSEVIGISGSRPKFDGQENVQPSALYGSMIGVIGTATARRQYIDIKDLWVVNSQYIGISGSFANYITISNCVINRTGWEAILINQSQAGAIIENNNSSEAVQAWGQANGYIADWSGSTQATNDWPGSVVVTRSTGAIIRKNILYKSFGEGYGDYGESHNILIEDNVVWNIRRPEIYSGASGTGYHIVRRNIVYRDQTDSTYGNFTTGHGIWFAREYTSGPADVYVYGNLIADTSSGITVENRTAGDTAYIYNNTIASTRNTVPANGRALTIGSDSGGVVYEVKNNIFQVPSGYTLCSNAGSSVTLANNLWSGQPVAACRAASDPGYSTYAANTIDLDGDGSWDSLTGGSVSAAPWQIGATSDAIDAGANIGSPYDVTIGTVQSTYSIPFNIITLSQNDYTPWDIGATIYNGGGGPGPSGGGTIAFDAVSTNSASAASSVTVSHTIGSGSNRFAKISVFWRNDTARTVSSITYDGQAATHALTSTNATTYDRAAVYYVLEASLPAAGTHNIVVTMSGACLGIEVVVETFEEVEQGVPEVIATATDDTDGNGAVSTNITTLTNGAWVFDSVISSYQTSATADAMQTETNNSASILKRTGTSYKVVATAGATTMGWTVDGPRVQHLVFSTAPSAGTPDPAPSITDIGTLNGAAFDDAQVLDIGIGESVYILFTLSEQIINFGNPSQSRVVYQVDYPASTDYYGAYIGQILIGATYYLEYEIRGGYTFDGTNWIYVNAMRETADLAISSISIGQATMEDGDGNQIDVTLGANTDPGTITISCPGIIKTTDPTAESLLNYDKVVLLSGSAVWTPTEDYLVVYVKGVYSGNITLTGVLTPCRVINPGKATGTNNFGSCTQHNQFPLVWK